MPGYDPSSIEPKWQAFWLKHGTFRAPDPGDPDFDPAKPKAYLLDMFPYPSGDGLHVGHPLGYTATDILARYKRMKGFNVLHPMGWDAFGLPAEQYAVKTGQHPAVTTRRNIETFRAQIRRLGFSYDWNREIATSDPGYYRWTQWIFRKLYEKGLAYQAEVAVWWCEELGTVLANEEVDSQGRSEVGGFPCVRRNMRQWMLRITTYAQRLLDDLKGLDWPHGIIKMQEDWIGRSEGADLDFRVTGPAAAGEALRVYTTRPDTLYGATYLVLAPEHPLAERLATQSQKDAVVAYLKASSRRSERDRMADTREKTGVFTGSFARNPATNSDIPIWIADYVLAGYGTGAIMAVPAHDDRDFAFAETMGLEIKHVVASAGGGETPTGCMTEEGVAVNSGPLNGMATAAAKEAMIRILEEKQAGKRVVRYRLRDWLFSRQRYWGEPFPIVFDSQGKAVLVGEDELPIALPEMVSFKSSGNFEPPLAKARDWIQTPMGMREANVMPQWAGSCWYFLRFLDPHNESAPWNREKADYWMPVDLYVGGAEHAVLHLLYARFWYKVFFDLGLVSQTEPFKKLYNQGMIIGTAYKTVAGAVVKTEDVHWISGKPTHPGTGEELLTVQAKMSKSLGNVVNPDDLIREFGADSLRLYEMFMGPLDQGKVWDTNGINGTHRFLKRAFFLIADESGVGCRIDLDPSSASDRALDRALHRCLRQVGSDIEGLRFNTAISAMMVFLNEVGERTLSLSQAKIFTLMLAPFAPHLAEELWERLGHSKTLAFERWPHAVDSLASAETVEWVVQVNGKLRARLALSAGLDAAAAERHAMADPKIQEYVSGHIVKKVIVVPDKLVNIVLGGVA